HDTHPGEKRAAPRGQTVSTIAPAYGHASLGRGSGPHQMLAQLHFSGDYGHHHSDNLNLTLWAKEREMLPDLGYTWTQMRYWTTCTLGHNLVVVDRKDQVGRPADGDLLSFFPGSSGVAVVEADGKRAYSNIKGLDTYRRLLVMIPVSEADAYVVDIFRVRGGAMHDWALHGDADEDTTAACSLALSEKRPTMLEAGEEWAEPTIEGARFNPYGMLRDMRKAETDAGFQVAFAYAQQPERGLRVHLLPGGRSEVWLGKSPSVRRMGYGISGDMRKAYDFWMPQLLVRRAGQAPLASVFVAVEEPFAGTPFITGVAPLKLTPADDGGVALQVRHGDAVDTIISTEQRGHPSFPGNMDVPFSVSGDGVQLRGHLGIVRRQSGKVTGAWLFEGQSLSGEGFSVKAERERCTGEIVAATRKADGAADDAFLTDAPLPVGDALRGAWMIVTYANGFRQGYEIDRVEKRDGKTWIILTDDHGLRIEANQTQEVFFPRRKMDGKNTFVIPLAATLARS
ncbi:MAG: hypothetical protein FJ272_18990, partial [Planctomycetes bacterium]|nr:hypothetical protein [Planctomycetota bacterium]